MGRSRGGLTTKLHALVDADGPVSLRLTGGQVHDACEAEALIEAVPEGVRLFGDKGYDSTARSIPADPIIVRQNWLRASGLPIAARGRLTTMLARQRSVRQGRQAADRRQCLQRHPRIARQLPCCLDGEAVRLLRLSAGTRS